LLKAGLELEAYHNDETRFEWEAWGAMPTMVVVGAQLEQMKTVCSANQVIGQHSKQPTAPFGNHLRPQPRAASSRLRFCPLAIITPSQFTFHSPRSRKRFKPCHCWASPNNGSTHTLRFCYAFLYALVW